MNDIYKPRNSSANHVSNGAQANAPKGEHFNPAQGLTDLGQTDLYQIENCVITTTADQSLLITIRGWYYSNQARPIILCLGISGYPLLFCERQDRADLVQANPIFKNNEHLYGFNLRLPLLGHTGSEASLQDLQLELNVTLDSGKTVSKTLSITPTEEDYQEHDRITSAALKEIRSLEQRETEFLQQREAILQTFLSTGQRLVFPALKECDLSIIVLANSKPALLYWTLNSLEALRSIFAELLVITNSPNEITVQLVRRLTGAQIITAHNDSSKSSQLNQAATEARGKYLLFLEAGVAPLLNSVSFALAKIKANDDIGAIGGQLIQLDQKLHSAGGISWRTGKCTAFGAGQVYGSSQTSFSRLVDFCPETLLLTTRNSYLTVGGFDSELSNQSLAADYCLKLQEQQLEIHYQPELAAAYCSPGISESLHLPLASAEQQRLQLTTRHRQYLQQKPLAEYDDENSARNSANSRGQLLFLVENTPLTNAQITLLDKFAAERYAVSVIGSAELLRPLALENSTREIVYTSTPTETVTKTQQRLANRSAILAAGRSECRLAWAASKLANDKQTALILDFRQLEQLASSESKNSTDNSIQPQIADFLWAAEGKELSDAIEFVLCHSAETANALRNADFRAELINSADNTNIAQLLTTALDSHWSNTQHLPTRQSSRPPSIIESSLAHSENDTNFDNLFVANSNQVKTSNTSVAANSVAIDVIIPIYNALDSLKLCLESVLRNSKRLFQLHLINDCSSDPAISHYLKQLAITATSPALIGINIINQKETRGFPASINRGIAESSGQIVILNSDTIVPSGWLDRLVAPIEQDCTIASVTPFSNNATICSFPALGKNNCLPHNLSPDQVDQYFSRYGPEQVSDLPTGIGFCMAINRAAIISVGAFDSELFGLGYAEENDWCQRALAAGFRNVLAGNLFVYHQGQASFDSRKKDLASNLRENNLSLLRQLHPRYQAQIQQFLVADPLAQVRKKLWTVINRLSGPASAKSYLCNTTLSGGSWSYLEQQLAHEKNHHRQYLLDILDQEIILQDLDAAEECSYRIRLGNNASTKLSQLFSDLNISSVQINQTVGMNIERVSQLLKTLTVPYSYFVHDYYSICPCAVLLCDDCRKERRLIDQVPSISYLSNFQAVDPEASNYARVHGIDAWRELNLQILHGAENVLAPSKSAADVLNSVYPEVAIEVVPHRPLGNLQYSYNFRFAHLATLTVAVVGAIGPQKGSELISALHLKLAYSELPLRLVILGYTDKQKTQFVSPDGKLLITGAYRQENLSKLLAQHRAGLVLIPSLWQETFSYTTQEALQCGYPVTCFSLGGPAEQVKKRKCGWIIPELSADAVFNQLTHLVKHREEIEQTARALVAGGTLAKNQILSFSHPGQNSYPQLNSSGYSRGRHE